MAVEVAKTVASLLFICLFVFYVRGVFEKYSQGLTTISQSQEDVVLMPLPTLTVCFDQPLKPSVRKRYGISVGPIELIIDGIKIDDSINMPQFAQEASYLLNRDIEIKLTFTADNDVIFLRNGLNTGKQNKTFHVQSAYLGPLGLCHIISTQHFIQPNIGTGIEVSFKDSVIQEDIPHLVKIFFTYKEEEVSGIRLGTSLEPYSISFEAGTIATLILNLVNYNYYPDEKKCKSYSSAEAYKCYKDKVIEVLDAAGSNFCIPYNRVDALPLYKICQTASEEREHFLTFLSGLANGANNCKSACNASSYSGYVEMSEKFTVSAKSTRIYFRFPSSLKTVQTEQLIYDFLGMVGSVGGSLGLFIGFSFLNVTHSFIDLIHRKYCSITSKS